MSFVCACSLQVSPVSAWTVAEAKDLGEHGEQRSLTSQECPYCDGRSSPEPEAESCDTAAQQQNREFHSIRACQLNSCHQNVIIFKQTYKIELIPEQNLLKQDLIWWWIGNSPPKFQLFFPPLADIWVWLKKCLVLKPRRLWAALEHFQMHQTGHTAPGKVSCGQTDISSKSFVPYIVPHHQ